MVKTVPERLLITVCLSLFVVAAACGGEDNPFNVKSERITQAESVSSMQFAPDGRLFYAQQFTGDIRIIKADGSPQAEPFAHVEPALYLQWGLTGLALDPNFEQNRYVYAYYTQLVSQQEETVTQASDSTASPSTVVRTIAQPIVIRFPSQDLSTPIGKLLRVNKEDGSPAPGNPFIGQEGADPRVFARGFREGFDFAFHPQTGTLYGTDNTPVDCEELNMIKPGANYGWPNVGEFPFAECGAGGQEQAIHYFAREGKQPGDFLSFVEVSALAFVSAAKYPTLGDSLLVCQLASATANGPAQQRMRHVVLSGAAFDQVTTDDTVVKDCRLSLAVSPDGTVYYSNDKEIKRLVPPKP